VNQSNGPGGGNGNPNAWPPQQGAPQQPQQGYPQQNYPQQQGGYAPAQSGYGPPPQPMGYPPQGAPYPQQAFGPQAPLVAPPKRTAAGVIALLLVLLVVGAAIVAFINLRDLGELSGDSTMPNWARTTLHNSALRRVHVFGGIAAVFAALAFVLSIVGARSAPGKVSLALSSLGLLSSFGILLSGAGYVHYDEPIGARNASPSAAAASASPNAAPSATVPTTRHSAFRLGDKLALSTLGRANAASASAVASVRLEAEAAAREVTADVPALPPLEASSAANNAAAMNYLLNTAGKPIATHLEARYDGEHAALFELALKLELLRMLSADPELRSGLMSAIKRLAERANVASSVEPVTSLAPSATSDEMATKIDSALASLDVETAKPRSSDAKPSAAAADTSKAKAAAASTATPKQAKTKKKRH
jgi:hypothetical protein